MRTFVTLLTFLIMMGLVPVVLKAQETFESLIKGAKYNDSLISNGKIRYKVYLTYNDTSLAKLKEGTARVAFEDPSTEYFLVFKRQELLRYEFKSIREQKRKGLPIKRLPIVEKYAYDGEKLTALSSDGSSLDGEIRDREEKGVMVLHTDPREFGLMVLRQPLGEVLGKGKVNLETMEEVNGHKCYKLDVTFPEEKTLKRAEIWIDPSVGYRFRRIRVYGPEGRKVCSIDSIGFKEVKEGIWFPVEGVQKLYSFRRGILTETKRLIVEEVKLNTDIPESCFEIKFPKGVSVYDFRTNESFIVGESK